MPKYDALKDRNLKYFFEKTTVKRLMQQYPSDLEPQSQTRNKTEKVSSHSIHASKSNTKVLRTIRNGKTVEVDVNNAENNQGKGKNAKSSRIL